MVIPNKVNLILSLMVWKLQSVYDEPGFYVKTASPCTVKSFEILLFNISTCSYMVCDSARQRYWVRTIY